MRIVGVTGGEEVGARRLKLRCPVCLREGTLDQRGSDRWVEPTPSGGAVSGERTCPNPECCALIYVIYKQDTGEVMASYPPERLDFDASQLPKSVQVPLEEAIDCHSHECYAAAAVMVRRTLECVCADQDASGKDLAKRIESLGEKITLPKGMIDALHNLRLLGNDAVHVEAQVYADIGKHEVEVAITVAKTILQATYQMDSLLGELEGLKTPENQSTGAEGIG
jgi:Domain of unknown function (DUF4145)